MPACLEGLEEHVISASPKLDLCIFCRKELHKIKEDEEPYTVSGRD